MKRILCTIVALLCAASLRAQSEPEKSAIEQAATEAGAQPHIAKNPPPLDVKNMDTSVKPQDDFYSYANGGWLKNNPIPPEYSRWGSFNELIEKNNDALHSIEEKAATESGEPKSGTAVPADVQKVGDFFDSGM